MPKFKPLAIGAVAALVVAVVAVGCATAQPTATAQPSATAQPTATSTPSPSPTASPIPLPEFGALAGTYTTTPFRGVTTSPCGPTPTSATPAPCPEASVDDTIRFTFTVPDEGWSGAPFQSIWLTSERNSAPGGAGMFFSRGSWLHSDPCVTDAQVQLNGAPPDVPVGFTVDDFANALAEHPLLDVTAPVDVTLAGYSGKYIDLQVPSDLSACPTSYFPWEGGGSLYAQGPSHRWHLWILEVDGVRVVIQTFDYPATSPQRRAELDVIVSSIQITH